MRALLSISENNPKLIAWSGAVFGWASFDFLRASQVVAAVLAALVSLCALVLTAPKAVREVRSWFR